MSNKSLNFGNNLILELNVDDIVLNPWNPNKMSDKMFNRLVNEIFEVGFIEPIQVVKIENNKYMVIGGEHRLLACKQLGYEKIPAVVLDSSKFDLDSLKFLTVKLNTIKGNLDPERFIALYNEMADKYGEDKLSELFAMQKDVLTELIDNIRNNLRESGIDITEFNSLVKNVKNVDELHKVLDKLFVGKQQVKEGNENFDDSINKDKFLDRIKTNIKLGDIIELGEHRIMCGDSFNIDNVNKLLNGNKIKMLFVDPEYDINVDKLDVFMSFDFSNAFFMLSDKQTISLCYKYKDYFRRFFVITFDKSKLRFNNSANNYLMNHLIVSHFVKGKTKNYMLKLHSVIKVERLYDDIRLHGKNQEIYDVFVKYFTRENDVVLDVFMGSGSLLFSCNKFGRRYFGIDIDPRKCQIVLNRYNELVSDIN